MVELRVERKWPREYYTIGRLYVNGAFFCNTLEDTDRGLSQGLSLAENKSRKVNGKTACPKGRYRVKLTYSPKFGKRSWALPFNGRLPLLVEVPAFEGVRIHVGNRAADTDGCLLVGRNKVVGGLVESTDCYQRLMREVIVPASKAGEDIWITIE